MSISLTKIFSAKLCYTIPTFKRTAHSLRINVGHNHHNVWVDAQSIGVMVLEQSQALHVSHSVEITNCSLHHRHLVEPTLFIHQSRVLD